MFSGFKSLLPGALALVIAAGVCAQPVTIEPPPGLLLLVRADAETVDKRRVGLTWQQVREAFQAKPLPDAKPAPGGLPLGEAARLELQQADQAAARGELFRAIRLLRGLERSFPNHLGVLRRLGTAYAMSGNHVRGAVYLERVLEHTPDDAGVLVLLSRHAAQQGELAEVFGYTDALAGQGQGALADVYRASALERLGYHTAAAGRLKPAIDALAETDLDKLQQAGQTDPAVLRELRVMTALVPELRLRLGDLLLSLDQTGPAAEQYAAVKLQDAAEPAAVVKRRVYLALRRGDQAVAIGQAVALLADRLAKPDDAVLIGYLAAQGVAPDRLADRLEAVMNERGPTLPLLAGLAKVADKGRVLAVTKRWLAEQSAEPESLRRAVALIAFDDDEPADIEPLTDLLVLTAQQMRREPSLARRYALALVGEVDAQVGLLRAVRLPAIADADDAYRQLVAAVVYEHTQRTAEAVQRYERALQTDPSLGGQVKLPLARMAYEAGRPDDAIKVLGNTPPNDWARLEIMAKSLATLGDARQAAALIDGWEARNGEDTASALLSIELIAIAGNPQQACSQLLRMINISPLDESLYRFGLDLVNNNAERFGDLHLAGNMWQAFVNRLNANLPDSVQAKVERADDIYDNPARFRETEQLLKDVLSQEPGNTRAWAMLVRAYELAGEDDQADAAHESLVEAGPPGFRRALSRARRAVSKGEMQRADAVLTRVLALEQEGVLPGPPMDGDDAASLLQLLGSADPEADLDEQSLAMVKRFPDNVQLNNALGYQWAVQGKNLLQAKAMIERAIDQGGGNHSVLDSLAWVQYKLGQFNQAEATQRRAIDLLREEQLRVSDQLSASKAVLYDHMGGHHVPQGRDRLGRPLLADRPGPAAGRRGPDVRPRAADPRRPGRQEDRRRPRERAAPRRARTRARGPRPGWPPRRPRRRLGGKPEGDGEGGPAPEPAE